MIGLGETDLLALPAKNRASGPARQVHQHVVEPERRHCCPSGSETRCLASSVAIQRGLTAPWPLPSIARETGEPTLPDYE